MSKKRPPMPEHPPEPKFPDDPKPNPIPDRPDPKPVPKPPQPIEPPITIRSLQIRSGKIGSSSSINFSRITNAVEANVFC